MTDSVISITIRDPKHLCRPYEHTGHTFSIDVYPCGAKTRSDYLFWNGVHYRGYPLDRPGKSGGRIHGQIKVPPGSYLIRGYAACNNVLTDWAVVDVGCGQTVCVNLLPTAYRHCLLRLVPAIFRGTVGGEEPAMKLFPREAEELNEAINKMLEKLPRDYLPPPPTIEELDKLAEKHKEREEQENK